MDTEATNQPKNERSRTRWTASLDKIFADLVVKQIQLGNRPNNIFDKKAWNHIRDEFNKQTTLNFNNNQLRKHLDVLRTRFYNLKSTYEQHHDFNLDDSSAIGFDLWDDIGVQAGPETTKVKDCPIYKQLCVIFMDASAVGKYAQSSHYVELDKSAGAENGDSGSYPYTDAPQSETPPGSRSAQVHMSSAERISKIVSERKRKRPIEAESLTSSSRSDQELFGVMAKSMFEMVSALKLRSSAMTRPNDDDKFTITNCIKALDEIQGIDDYTYFSALDLFEDPNLRETFLSLTSERIRLTWLHGKCDQTSLS